MRTLTASRVAILMVLGACSGDLEVKPLFNHSNGRIVIQTNQDLDGKQVYTQARRGS